MWKMCVLVLCSCSFYFSFYSNSFHLYFITLIIDDFRNPTYGMDKTDFVSEDDGDY